MYDPGAMILLINVLSNIIAQVFSVATGGLKGWKQCWDFRFMLKILPGSCLFTVGQILKFQALRFLPTDLMVLLDQSQLVLLAICSKLFLGRKYTPPQWILLMNVMVLMTVYFRLRQAGQKKGGSDDKGAGDMMIGFCIMMGCVLVSVAGGLMMEFLLKGDPKKRSYITQQALLSFPTFWVTCLYRFVLNPMIPVKFGGTDKPIGELFTAFFEGWTGLVYLVFALMYTKMWLSGLIAKVLDSVIKQMGSSCGVLLIYCESLILPPPFGDENAKFEPDVFLALGGVLLTMVTFTLDAGREKMHTNMERVYQEKIDHATDLAQLIVASELDSGGGKATPKAKAKASQ
jgi:drug/metabolite transporter (DMT)-like permease